MTVQAVTTEINGHLHLKAPLEMVGIYGLLAATYYSQNWREVVMYLAAPSMCAMDRRTIASLSCWLDACVMLSPHKSRDITSRKIEELAMIYTVLASSLCCLIVESIILRLRSTITHHATRVMWPSVHLAIQVNMSKPYGMLGNLCRKRMC